MYKHLLTGFLRIILLLILTACGGGGATETVADAGSVDTGKVVSNGDWEAELTRPTEQSKIVGEGNIVYNSQVGTYLIVFLQVTNKSGTLQVVPRELLKLQDGQGNDYKAVKSAIQVAYIQHKGKGQGLEIILDSPMKDAETREGVVVFEIPEDASALTLVVNGVDEQLSIGF